MLCLTPCVSTPVPVPAYAGDRTVWSRVLLAVPPHRHRWARLRLRGGAQGPRRHRGPVLVRESSCTEPPLVVV